MMSLSDVIVRLVWTRIFLGQPIEIDLMFWRFGVLMKLLMAETTTIRCLDKTYFLSTKDFIDNR